MSTVIPMFGHECDSRNLGHRLADLAAETFASIQTRSPGRVLACSAAIELPLDAPPSAQTLDREIEEVEDFISSLERNPATGLGARVQLRRQVADREETGLSQAAGRLGQRGQEDAAAGQRFPTTWTRHATAWLIDDLGLVFDTGETFVEISMEVSAQSPLAETLLQSLCNGADGYLTTDAERSRGGYRALLNPRYRLLADGVRPLPYALGAADRYVDQVLNLLEGLEERK